MVLRRHSLEGKVAIVTGGGTGLGKSLALTLAKEGANIVVAGRRAEPIKQTAKEVSDLGTKGLAIPADVTNSQQVNALVEQTLREMGRIDILINNAGGGAARKPIWDITDDEWYRGINTNLTSTFFCCREVGKHFVAQKNGRVINIASGDGLRGRRDDYMYGCSKGGVIQLTRILAITWAQDNVQVNCIAPGIIDTRSLQPDFNKSATMATERNYAGRKDFIPVGRIGMPQDIGSLGLFLASDASDYITGGIFTVDGGGLVGGCAPTGFTATSTGKED